MFMHVFKRIFHKSLWRLLTWYQSIEVWSHLWFAGVHEGPSWFSIVGATVTVHQFFGILHFCHTCSLCRVELVVQFPASDSTQVSLCLFPSVLWLWHFLTHPCQASIYSLSLYRGHSWRVWLAKQEMLTPPRHLVSPLVCRGPWMSTVILYSWCHSDSAFYRLNFDNTCTMIWYATRK